MPVVGALPAVTSADPLQPGLTLGGIVFLNDEHPAKLPTPLTQRMSVHELPGGFRQVQAMGVQPGDITWNGTLWDQQAAAKKNALKALEKQGQPVTLEWNDEKYSVLIKTFDPTIINEFRIEYALTCTVVADLCGAYTTAVGPSIDQQTQALYSSAKALNATVLSLQSGSAPAVPSALDGAITQLGSLLDGAGPLAATSPSNLLGIAQQIASVTSMVASYQTTLTAALPSGAIPSTLGQLVVATAQLGNTIALIGQNAQVGQASKVVTVNGGTSLFEVAAQYYGDATLAPLIRSANNLASMQLPAGAAVSLQLPPATATGLA